MAQSMTNKPSYWQLIRLITCRALMIAYSVWLIVECSLLFNNNLIYLNCAFLILIIIDGILVGTIHDGLEDRWCSLSIVFFVCGTSIPFWLLEITSSVVLVHQQTSRSVSSSIVGNRTSLSSQVDLLKRTNESFLSSNQRDWFENASKNLYMSMLGKHEALFSSVLIVCRIFIPQAALTWSDISSQSEFAFNTIFDIYATLSMLRDPRVSLPRPIWIVTFVVCNGALYPIALNGLPQTHQLIDENDHTLAENILVHGSLQHRRFRRSLMNSSSIFPRFERITQSPYFRICLQIVLADFPFLVLRLIILANLRFVRREMYYLIAKQFIIIFCKLGIMANDWCRQFLHRLALDEIKRINESSVEWKIK